MGLPLDRIILFDGNKEGFNQIINVTKPQVKPVKSIIIGPAGCGKSTVMMARANQKDLLSTKTVGYYHTSELSVALMCDAPDAFFEKMGSVNVLLLDELSSFFREGGDVLLLCKLLINERNRLGLDTVIASDINPNEFDLDFFEGALDDFDLIDVAPLDKKARISFVKQAESEFCHEKETQIHLDEAAKQYLANEFSADLREVRHAVQYLVSAAGFENGHIVTIDDCMDQLR